jgi:transposase
MKVDRTTLPTVLARALARGETYAEIAASLGICLSSVARWCMLLGYPPAHKATRRRAEARHGRDVVRTVEEGLAAGHSLRQIARQVGLSHELVRQWQQRFLQPKPVARRRVGRPLSFRITVTEGQRQELEAWTNNALIPEARVRLAWLVLHVAGGMPVQTAAQEIGLSRRHATKWLHRWRRDGLAGLRDRRETNAPPAARRAWQAEAEAMRSLGRLSLCL